MASDLYLALEFDKDELSGKTVAIVENSGSNANFIVSALLCHCIELKTPICLLTVHNTFGHYNNVCIKLGRNLNKLKEEGFVKCIDTLTLTETLFRTLPDIREEDYVLGENRGELLLKDFFMKLKLSAEGLLQSCHKPPCIVIDDLTDFLVLGCSASSIISFFQYCRAMVSEMEGVSLVCLCHVSEDDFDSLKIISGISHACNIKVEVSGLNTGVSYDVSGLLKIEKNLRLRSNKVHKKNLHFKLEERRIMVFCPGTSPAFV